MKLNYKNKKAFTLIELLIVIAIIGILFIVLVSRVDFATDKAKATGVQTDFRSFQMALETVSKENAGFASLGWNTGDDNGDRVRNSYDEGDIGTGVGTPGYHNGKVDSGEIWTGHKVYGETWSDIYTLVNPADDTDTSAFEALEAAVNANLDPKLHITITPELSGTALTGNAVVTMANGAQDPWKKEYHGVYMTNAVTDNGADRGAFVIYSDGANGKWGSEHKIEKGVVTVTVPGNNIAGKDDYSLVIGYTNVNGYGETKFGSTGFSNNQSFLSGGNNGNSGITNTPDNGGTPPVEDNNNEVSTNLNQYVWTIVDDESMSIVFNEQGGLDVYYNFVYNTTIPSQCISVTDNIIVIAGTGDYDGEYTVQSNGNLTVDGYLVATARLSLFDEQGNFRYMNIKFDAPNGYIVANEQGLSGYHRDGTLEYRIPLSSIDINPVCAAVTDSDGTIYIYYDRNGTRMIGVNLEYAETYVGGFLPGYCDHRGIDNHLWYDWYDSDMNCIGLGSLPSLELLKTCTLRCNTCMEEIPTKIIGNYIYLYNTFMEPYMINGEYKGYLCPDMFYPDVDIDGWFAVAYDSAVTDGLLAVIDGKPVTAVSANKDIIIPATTKLFYNDGGLEDNVTNEFTYAGTMDAFELILPNDYSNETFANMLRRYVSSNYYPKFIIHCSDGDIVIE